MIKPISAYTILLFGCLFMNFSYIFAQQVVKGKLVVSESDTPLKGARITVKGTSVNTVTDAHGNFTLHIDSTENPTLEFNAKGFIGKEMGVSFNENTILDLGTVELVFDIYNIPFEDLLNIKVVSASKSDQKFFETSANVSVITRSDIEISGAENIPDLLRNVAGLDIMCGWASSIDVGGRGLNLLGNSKTLVLLNGQRVNNDFTGAVRWAEIPVFLSEIERIEILTSPQSALYGANSFSALINIITKPDSDFKSTDIVMRMGENETQQYQIGYGNNFKNFDFRFNLGMNKTEGWGNRDSTKIKEKVMPYVNPNTGDTLSGKIKDWYNLSKATFDITYHLNPQSKINVSCGVNFGTVSNPDLSSSLLKIADNNFDTHNFRSMLEYSNNFSENAQLTIQASSVHGEDLGGYYKAKYFRNDGNATFRYNFSEINTLVSGMSAENVSSKSPYMEKNQVDKLFGIFVQDELKINSIFKITAGVRFDKHTSLNWQYSPRITMNISPIKNHYFRLGFGQAFRKPSFLENYNYHTTGTNSIVLGMVTSGGHSKPEKISSYNLDYYNILGKITAKLSLFKNNVTDLIDTKKVQPYGIYNYAIIYQNHGKININGGEFELKAKTFQYLEFFANVSYQTIKYETSIIGQKISVPEIKGNAGAQFNLQKGLFANAVIHYTGKKETQYSYIYTLPDNSTQYYFMQLPASSILDINLGYNLKLSKIRMQFSVACFNVFNTKHIEYAVFDSSRAYFGLDTPERNYTEEMKREFENRNALNDRKLMLNLELSF
ncbi:MAG TPA: hypothetical protein DCY97_06955 [Marinilabiliales bacterium]|nr:hypothetical protein [Marinilabiliales bacterium]